MTGGAGGGGDVAGGWDGLCVGACFVVWCGGVGGVYHRYHARIWGGEVENVVDDLKAVLWSSLASTAWVHWEALCA